MNAPKKTYYSISEVCSMTSLEPHVLRYWESEFTQLHPKKNRAGNRAYREKDIETIEYIKYLLYEEQYTIPGAKKKCASHLKDQNGATEGSAVQPGENQSDHKEIVAELKEIQKLLESLN